MEKETRYYMESINQNPNWLKMVIIEIDKCLIDSEYIDYLWNVYAMKQRQRFHLILPNIENFASASFEKLALSQL